MSHHLLRQRAHRRLGRVLGAMSSSSAGEDAGVAVLDEAVEVLLPDGHFSAAGQLTVRRATQDDAATLALVTSYGFAASRSLQSIADDPFGRQNRRPVGEAQEDFDEQTWGAFEGDRAVSQLKAHAWTLSGGTNCDVAAVSGVGTLPEFRRIGLLRSMMGLLFQDMVSRGQPVAALLASQAAIYQRFGFSEAVRDARSYTIDTVDLAFVDGDGGSCTVGREPMNTSLEPTLREPHDYSWHLGCILPKSTSNNRANRPALPAVRRGPRGMLRLVRCCQARFVACRIAI